MQQPIRIPFFVVSTLNKYLNYLIYFIFLGSKKKLENFGNINFRNFEIQR